MAQYDELLDRIRNGTTDQSVSDDASVQSNIMSQGGRTAGEARANARLLGQDSGFSQGAAQAQTSAFNSTAKAKQDRITAMAPASTPAATTDTKTTATGAAAGTMSQFSAAANATNAPSTTAATQPRPTATATSVFTPNTATPASAPSTQPATSSTPAPQQSTSSASPAPTKPSNYNALVTAAQGFGQDTRNPTVQASMAAAQSELLRSGFNANGTWGTQAAGAPQQVVPGNSTTNTPINYNPSPQSVHQGNVVRANQNPYNSNYNQLLSNIMNGGVTQGAPTNTGNAGYTSAGTSTYGQYNPGGYTTPGTSTSAATNAASGGNPAPSQYGPGTGIVPPGGAPTSTAPAVDPDVNPFASNPNSYAYQQWEQNKRNAANAAAYANTAAQQKASLAQLSAQQNAANLAKLAKQNQATAADRQKLAKANNAMEAKQGSKAQQMAATNQTTSNPQYAALLKSLLGYR